MKVTPYFLKDLLYSYIIFNKLMNDIDIIVSIFKTMKFDILTYITDNHSNFKYDIANIQEGEIIRKLNRNSTFNVNFIAYSVDQFLLEMGYYWNAFLDSVYGDIVILNKSDRTPLMFIDLKVPERSKKNDKFKNYGNISYMSLKNMALENNGASKRNRYYLCLNNDGEARFINAYDCYTKLNNLLNNPFVNSSDYIFKSKYREDKYNTDIQLTDSDYLNGKDCLNTAFYKKFPELNLINKMLNF